MPIYRSITFFNKQNEKLEKEIFFRINNLSDLVSLFKAEKNDPDLILEYEIKPKNRINLEKIIKVHIDLAFDCFLSCSDESYLNIIKDKNIDRSITFF